MSDDHGLEMEQRRRHSLEMESSVEVVREVTGHHGVRDDDAVTFEPEEFDSCDDGNDVVDQAPNVRQIFVIPADIHV